MPSRPETRPRRAGQGKLPAMRVVVVAPSGPVDRERLEGGVARLRGAGAEVEVHPHALAQTPLTAGTDEQRLAAVADAAWDSRSGVVWAARGGYGATRLLPALEKLTAQRGVPPRKLLVGYSDVTALHAFARRRWGWATLHGLMVVNKGQEWPETLAAAAQGERPGAMAVGWWTPPPAEAVEAELVGGNLALVAALCGTPDQIDAGGRLLFLEDVNEPLYKIDRMLMQLDQAGVTRGCRGLVLGTFSHTDEVEGLTLREVVLDFAGRTGLPVAAGLPAGHGDDCRPVPLGATWRITPAGEAACAAWDWAGG